MRAHDRATTELFEFGGLEARSRSRSPEKRGSNFSGAEEKQTAHTFDGCGTQRMAMARAARALPRRMLRPAPKLYKPLNSQGNRRTCTCHFSCSSQYPSPSPQSKAPEQISGRSRVHGRGQSFTGRRCFRALPPPVLQASLGQEFGSLRLALSYGMEHGARALETSRTLMV